MRVSQMFEQYPINAIEAAGARASREDCISGLRYALFVASRQIIDAQAGRNEPSTVLLVKGSLATILGMCLSTDAEVSDPIREQCTAGKAVDVRTGIDKTCLYHCNDKCTKTGGIRSLVYWYLQRYISYQTHESIRARSVPVSRGA